MAVILSTLLIFTINPTTIAISLLGYSILSTNPLYQISNSSWIPFILILTFSSGIITLFMYASSLSSNEINNTNNNNNWIPLVLLTSAASVSHQETTQESINAFSSNIPLTTISLLLILTLSALTTHSHQPFQTLNSSF